MKGRKLIGSGLNDRRDFDSRSFRSFERDPGFKAAAVITLALGIAANTSVFSIVYTALLRPLAYKHADRVVMLWASIPGKNIPADWTSWPTMQDWRKQSASFDDVATELRIDSATLTGQDEPEQVNVGRFCQFVSFAGCAASLGKSLYNGRREASRQFGRD
ncbi:MAG: hypothetical protein WA324_21335 [Bryobacteraceae bacterium]